MEQIKLLRRAQLLSRITSELEVTLGASEPTLAEYILDKYEVSNGSAPAFRSILQKEAGIDGIHVDRLHSLISTLKLAKSYSQGIHKPTVRLPQNAAVPGLAIANTKEYAKQQYAKMLEEADTALTRSSGHGTAHSTQERHSPDHGVRDRDMDRNGGARALRQQRATESRSERSPDMRRTGGRSPNQQDCNGRSMHGSQSQYDRSGGRGGGRHRSRSPGRSSRRDGIDRQRVDRDQGRSPVRGGRPRDQPERDLPDAPEASAVYRGTVKNTARHGAYVELAGLRGRVEGMIHVSNLSNRRVNEVSEICKRGDEVWVKVLSIQPPQPGQPRARIDLSLRDVDQSTGQDLLPVNDAATHPIGTGLRGLSGVTPVGQAAKPRRRKRELSEAEIFEIRQLIASGVKHAKDYPEVMELNDSDEDEATAAMVHKPADEALQDFEECPDRLLPPTTVGRRPHQCSLGMYRIALSTHSMLSGFLAKTDPCCLRGCADPD
eukprot:jgi/Ulvmu1/3553/UM166_0007.1